MTTTPTRTTQTIDAHGNAMTGDAATVALYDRALDRFLRFHPAIVDLATELAMQDAPVPMAHALVAYLQLSSTDPRDLGIASDVASALAVADGNEREQLHARAVAAWAAGDWHGAARLLDDLLQRWPTDLLALMMGHQLDFFVGDARNLRDRPTRTLHALDPEHPHASFVRGMAAFGLEECGHYAQAIDAGSAAIEAHPDDVWAIHAVTHAHEMQGQVAEGIRFLEQREADWGSGNLFTVHNWWHLALFHLEAGRPERSLAIYDAEVHTAESAGVPLELVDASAMLWRFALDGVGTGDRFASIADAWTPVLEEQPWYAFNDVHGAMALAGAGRLGDVHRRIKQLDAWLDGASGSNARMTAEVGLPSVRAVVAFTEGRHHDVIAELAPIRSVLHHFGGSHAQRDALQRTLLESALRADCFELARALTADRLAVRDTSPYTWSQRARAMRGLGDEPGAQAADRTAGELLAGLAVAS